MGAYEDAWGDVPEGLKIVGVLMDNLNSTNRPTRPDFLGFRDWVSGHQRFFRFHAVA
jgi:hypothetical protein